MTAGRNLVGASQGCMQRGLGMFCIMASLLRLELMGSGTDGGED